MGKRAALLLPMLLSGEGLLTVRVSGATALLKRLPPAGEALPFPVTCGKLLRLIEELLGDDLRRFPDGRMLIWDIARHDGYRIPEYPMAGCGDVREFLADEGARNVPDWYERHLGISREQYDQMYAYELVMVRNRALWRRVFVVPQATMAQTSLSAGPLLEELHGWLAFALGEQTAAENPVLFQR
jgi:hypothetical protein